MIESRVDNLLSSVELGPLEAAYLAEGVPRAVGASLAGLAHMGLIRVQSDRKVVALEAAPPSLLDPIQRSVIRCVSGSASPSSVEDIRKYAEPAMQPVRDALRASGLLLDDGAVWTGGLAIVVGALTACIGGLSAASGGVSSTSVFWGLVFAIAASRYLIKRRRRTGRGNAVLKRLQEEHAALRETAEHAPALLTPTDLALAVAIYGPALLEGGPLDYVGQALKRERYNRGACGGVAVWRMWRLRRLWWVRMMPPLGLGIGWRPELALAIERREALGFVEVTAENIRLDDIPPALTRMTARGVPVIVHGLSLSLGGAERPDPRRLDHLVRVAQRLGARLVSEHLAFVRAEGLESGHLLPVPRTRESLEAIVENVAWAKRMLPFPLALENIATLVEWPGAMMDEASFLAELLERTDTCLLFDVSNMYANARNRGWDPVVGPRPAAARASGLRSRGRRHGAWPSVSRHSCAPGGTGPPGIARRALFADCPARCDAGT